MRTVILNKTAVLNIKIVIHYTTCEDCHITDEDCLTTYEDCHTM